MLDEDVVEGLISDMWTLHLSERARFDRVYSYVKGRNGVPELPEGSGRELQELAALSVKNVLALVRDSFAQNLSVVGFREAGARQNDSAWRVWQANRMDARQSEVYRSALTYGVGYVTVLPGDDGPVWRPRSPRQIVAVYEDPQVDAWPQYALETWLDTSDGAPRRKALFLDAEWAYPLDLGEVPRVLSDQDKQLTEAARPFRVEEFGEPYPHGAEVDGVPVCPVVRFVNDRDTEDLIVGEIEPLIVLQKAINSVNLDRLIVSRFGAFPQKVISGWSAAPDEVLRASASRVWAFEDENVKASALPSADVGQYNELLTEMLEHVAMVAQISPAQLTGKMVNVSAEALAAAEANQQRKLTAKRESFGESWEQVLRVSASMDDDPATAVDTLAEVVWRDTEARSFGAVVDGVTKLSAAGVPIEALLTMVPGMTQQQVSAVQDSMRASAVRELVAGLPAQAEQARQDPQVGVLTDRTEG